MNRRSFLGRTSLVLSALAFPYVAKQNVLGANGKLRLAAVGVGGKGEADIHGCSTEDIVALCDVDQARAAATQSRYPNAKRFRDYRVLFDQYSDQIDGVIISTPDHSHAHPALLAMMAGKHVYCQKPLTHTVYEARLLTQAARKFQVVTQMGNQGHCHPDSRRLVELIQAGVLGEVKSAHVWTDRPIWPQGIPRPDAHPKVPDSLDWDLWLGPAPYRPFHPDYVPFTWRGRWDFGTGAIGDMGCHNMDLAFWALELRDPVEVVTLDQEGMTDDSPPSRSIIRWTFPPSKKRGSVTLTWYDGGLKPDPADAGQKELPLNGCIIVGSKDTLFVPMYWGAGTFLSGATMDDYAGIPQTLPRFPGAAEDNDFAHHQEWVHAVKGIGRAMSNFDYSGPMTEAVLLGNVAMRAASPVRWDAVNLRVRNNPAADSLIHKEYRKGWELPVF